MSFVGSLGTLDLTPHCQILASLVLTRTTHRPSPLSVSHCLPPIASVQDIFCSQITKLPLQRGAVGSARGGGDAFGTRCGLEAHLRIEGCCLLLPLFLPLFCVLKQRLLLVDASYRMRRNNLT